MNARIEELFRQSGGSRMVTFANDSEDSPSKVTSIDFDPPETFDKFVELIVRRCAIIAQHYTPDSEELDYSHLIKNKILEHFGVEQ